VTPWEEARRVAAARAALPAGEVPLAAASGLVLAAPVIAATDLPPFDGSAMDGWAVAGPGPWEVVGDVAAGAPAGALGPGQAVRVATGALLPEGSTAVVRRERGSLDGTRLHPLDGTPGPGADVRRAGGECRAGDVVAEPGDVCVPALLGLLAAAGADLVSAVRRPVAQVLVLGDELLVAGPAHGPLVRDALGPMLPPWLRWAGADVEGVLHVADDADPLRAAIRRSTADVLVTTGSTARGPRDHLHAVLAESGARVVVDGVAVRPGHPMLLAELADGRPVVGLPGNPLAAVSALATLAHPLLAALAGRRPAVRRTTVLREAVGGPPTHVRLLPVRDGRPALHLGPAMLRGLVGADGLAVVPAGGAAAGAGVELLPLPG